MAFKFNFPAPCRHVSDAEQDNCEEACEGRICPSEGKVPINRGGETVPVYVVWRHLARKILNLLTTSKIPRPLKPQQC
ncbi:uncharacterized protein LOC143242429 isoform X5 [Tachypleus tridentatus]|uniref:uncharacterized protein LOC143242429 isoform X5 n=1 Tax=Tachypleus tridentatus TaxID=6853 RepID=UPI003FD54AEF